MFDSHAEFAEWFAKVTRDHQDIALIPGFRALHSKTHAITNINTKFETQDIESAATGLTSKLDQRQLKRLHMILKPFMLRRVKVRVFSDEFDNLRVIVAHRFEPTRSAMWRAKWRAKSKSSCTAR